MKTINTVFQSQPTKKRLRKSRRVEPNIFIQVTSEAVGMYTAKQQFEMIHELKPNAVSIGLREIRDLDENVISDHFHKMKEANIFPQLILYNNFDLDMYSDWIKRQVIPGNAYPILLVIGKETPEGSFDNSVLTPEITENLPASSWMICAFGPNEYPAGKLAVDLGGNVRLGFENNCELNNGSIAKNNAELITQMETIDSANITEFINLVNKNHQASIQDYAGLHKWSTQNPESFWSQLWDYSNVIADQGNSVLENGDKMPGAVWYSDSSLNFAENLLKNFDNKNGNNADQTAIVFWGEDQIKRSLNYADLKSQVASMAAYLKSIDINPGDVVAGFMPNVPESVICMLATTSIGAVWTSCSPDFGVQGVVDRFGQVEPKVFIAANAYFYNGKTHNCLDKLVRFLQAATLMLYDGSPFYPGANILWDYADQENINVFGTSAKYIDVLRKDNVDLKSSHSLASINSILSTGSVLAPESYDYIYDKVKTDVCLSSISGGTDIVSCFALGCPILPVYRGELQCKGLGMQVEIWNDKGETVVNEKGELVCAKPFPCMPIGFWNDPDGKKYFDAYFATYENTWCHGDYVTETENGGLIFYGRSDTVLNPGGVRIGTAEIYRQVEKLDEVQESIVIGQDWQDDVRVVLFVKLTGDLSLNDDLTDKIKKQIRSNTTPSSMFLLKYFK
ncbi:Acetoacetyl-coenzyme A synthetase [Nymphon striatum]|nr:Acetoacetyl-coenzyme A synthetase [Nymphon striatum]